MLVSLLQKVEAFETTEQLNEKLKREEFAIYETNISTSNIYRLFSFSRENL